MNRMGPVILVLATANALAGAAVAGAGAAIVVFIGIVAAGWLFFHSRAASDSAAPQRPAVAQGLVVGRQGGLVLVRVGGRDQLARPTAGSPMPGYGDAVVIEGTEGEVLVVRTAGLPPSA
jgi:membrane protein implicated in regulation of membrane protease activity